MKLNYNSESDSDTRLEDSPYFGCLLQTVPFHFPISVGKDSYPFSVWIRKNWVPHKQRMLAS